MHKCQHYNPDKIFRKFKVIEFPTSFVGLSTSIELDMEINLNTSAYLKTMHEGYLMKFDDAREVSASHRAFTMELLENTLIKITFKPSNECISKMKRNKQSGNRFVFDLRLIQVDGNRCCCNELHSEIGRYYISGQFEYCTITHNPRIINYGDIALGSTLTKHIRIKNDSNLIAAKIQYVRVTGYKVSPENFTIPPNSSKRICVTIKAICLRIANTLVFRIRNPHDLGKKTELDESELADENFIKHIIRGQINVIYKGNRNELIIESLHKLCEENPIYTYIGKEKEVRTERNKKAFQLLEISKSSRAMKPITEKLYSRNEKCYVDVSITEKKLGLNFCKPFNEKITAYELFNIIFVPFHLDFGRVGLQTYGKEDLTIKNKTKYHVTIRLLVDNCVLYTKDKLSSVLIKLKAFSEIHLTVFCLGLAEGNHKGTFEYKIDNKYQMKHFYSLHVGNPSLTVIDKYIKFGMVTTESFVTSVPVRIYNYFNTSVNFEWSELQPEVPFEIIPMSGVVPRHSCKICDVIYVCKATKTKTHEVDLISINRTSETTPIELNIMTRKLSIKFLQAAVMFKDIALNLEVVEKVKLENSSREIALFHVVEPLIPGCRVEPMSGIIRPKMVISFAIIIQISCVLEFTFDILVKINNKENVILPIAGNVVEPKIIIHPKNIYMARIPCDMITYVPVTFQNVSSLKSVVEVLDTGDDNIFNVYIGVGNEKQRVFKFWVDGGQSKTVFIKVYDVFRREYEMYIPFKINNLLGPPNQNASSTELQYYIGEYEQFYENNPKVKLKTINKDISYCRITGVITVPWIRFSVDKFEIEYVPNGNNSIYFTMTNVSKYYLYVTISVSKLLPHFTLNLLSEEEQCIVNETHIKFELDRQKEASLSVTFHPKGHGKFVAVALLFLDKHMAIPYYNLTFIGRRQTPLMTPNVNRVIFPPCYVGIKITRNISIKIEGVFGINSFSCGSKEESNLSVKFTDTNVVEVSGVCYTILNTEIAICSQTTYSRNIILNFNNECGSWCDVEVSFCFTYCPLTLHANHLVKPDVNPYPYFPLETQSDLYEYMEVCSKFLEKWLFQQGFRRDLYPVIPDTFHAISSAISSHQNDTKSKGMNVSYLNFVRRIAGPLMKYIRKVIVSSVDDSFKCVKEIHDTYKEIINLLKSRGADLWSLRAKFLLSYDQFLVYFDNAALKRNADITMSQELITDPDLFKRLNKQSWIDFILQSYKVFVMDSCFFECVCVSSQERDVVKILIDWYNEQIKIQHKKLRGKKKHVKVIDNLTQDLTDGIALIAVILSYCPFLEEHFSIFCEIEENNKVGSIINNACLIIEAMNQLRLYFPLASKDFLNPNFLQMLFLSIHLYVALPMYKPKDSIQFSPPLLRSSTRLIAINPTTQENLLFNYLLLNNTKNNFIVEKAPQGDNGKKMFLSVKYTANFVNEERVILLVHGYNKTRIFDTYIIFLLRGCVGSLNPVRKSKVMGPLYRPNKVDVVISSPFTVAGTYTVSITDNEPTIPVEFENNNGPKFYIRRLNLIDKEISLLGIPKEGSQDVQEHKLYLQIICLSTQIGNSWIWFRGEAGEFFIRVTTQPRWDLAIDTLQAKVHTWPMDPCSCGEACECYRTTVLMIPHRNELMLKALRYALLEHASEAMMEIFDRLIGTTTGKIILGMLLSENGVNMSEVNHILHTETTYRITSRALLPRLDHVVLTQHTPAMLALPVTVPSESKSEKYTVTFTSECGMDIRTYRILFIETQNGDGTF